MPVDAPLWADRKLKSPFCAGTSGARRVAPGVERRATLHPWGWTHAAGRGRVRFIGVPQGKASGRAVLESWGGGRIATGF